MRGVRDSAEGTGAKKRPSGRSGRWEVGSVKPRGAPRGTRSVVQTKPIGREFQVGGVKCQEGKAVVRGPSFKLHTPHGKLGRRPFARNEANRAPRLRVWWFLRPPETPGGVTTNEATVPNKANSRPGPPSALAARPWGRESAAHQRCETKPICREDVMTANREIGGPRKYAKRTQFPGEGADWPRSAKAGRPPLGLGVRNKANSGGVSSGKCRV